MRQSDTSQWTALRAACCALLLLAASASGYGPAQADAISDFYKGKSLTFIIGSGPGGGYDFTGRLVAQHLGRFIPGNPAIVPRNIPGASSLVAAQNLYNLAARDGTTLGLLQPTLVLEKVMDRSLKFEAQNFAWIGRVDALDLFGIVWRDAPVMTIADAKRIEIPMAANGPSGTSATIPWALNRMIGTKFKVVLGYNSTAATGLSLERGETSGIGSTSWEYLETKRDWLEGNKIAFLYTIALARSQRQPDAPAILELPDGERDRSILKLIASSSTLGRAILAPPGVPAERTAALRQAFDRMLRDPDFLADAKQRRLGVNPLPGAALEAIVAEVANPADELVEALKRVTAPPN
jgi:tripartite-type tricarboxylate transporter receptor subunit TctC